MPTFLCLLTCLTLSAPPRVREIDLRLDSRPAGPDGLAVRLAVPPRARYGDEGAPIAVLVPGGWGTGELRQIGVPLATEGFLEVRFEFPGGERSDLRGAGSVEALADVLAFAGGLASDRDGRTITELAAPLTALTDEVGLLGLSNGGNAAILALAQWDRKARGVGWVTTWESPIGDGAATALAGSRQDGVNPAYDPETGTFDFSTLTYAADQPVLLFGGPPGGHGAFYFELKADGRLGQGDYLPRALAVPGTAGLQQYVYPLSLTRAAESRGLAKPWPKHLLGSQAAAEFWSSRDASGHFLEATVNRPDLLAMVLGTDRDHVQAAPDHPHILAAYQGWLDAHIRWVRLNPDETYLKAVAGDAASSFLETVANLPLTRQTLPTQLVPFERIPRIVLMLAGAAEMADRYHAGTLAPDLDELLYPTAPLPRAFQRER